MFTLKSVPDQGIAIVEPTDEIVYLLPEKLRGGKFGFRGFDCDPNETMMVLPKIEEEQRDCIFITGRSGSGKSTWCAKYAQLYNTMFPDKRVVIVSALEQDKAFDDLDFVERLVLDEEFAESEVSYDQFENALIIFDDIWMIKDKQTKTAVVKLMNEILDLGRHQDLTTLITAHITTNYAETRKILSEIKMIVLFGHKTNATAQRYLKNYSGLNKKNIELINKLPSKWVAVNLTEPVYIIHEKGMFQPLE